jgi:fucose 4-O-acetylase-like acetyltransferase
MDFSSRLSATALLEIDYLQQSFGWCVIAFFFCAGMLTDISQRTISDWLKFTFKRARRLLVPCLVFSLTYKISLIALKQVAGIGARIQLPGNNILNWIIFGFGPIGPQFYFLPYLFIISSISVLVLILEKKRKVWRNG